MKKEKLFILVLLLITIAYVGCQKGDTGPAGVQGATGTANVMYSGWNVLSMSYSSSDSAYEQTINADSLTQAVLDSGMVLTYMKYTDPSTNQVSIVNAGNYLNETYSVGSIALYSIFDYTGFSYRYIIIPGGVKAGRLSSGALQQYTKKQLEAMSYDEVMKKLGRSSD